MFNLLVYHIYIYMIFLGGSIWFDGSPIKNGGSFHGKLYGKLLIFPARNLHEKTGFSMANC